MVQQETQTKADFLFFFLIILCEASTNHQIMQIP